MKEGFVYIFARKKAFKELQVFCVSICSDFVWFDKHCCKDMLKIMVASNSKVVKLGWSHIHRKLHIIMSFVFWMNVSSSNVFQNWIIEYPETEELF